MTTTAAQEPIPEPQSLAAGTEYMILEWMADADVSEKGMWLEVGTVTARDSTQAIKDHLAGQTEIDGRFVATPARSWKPVSVKTKIALDIA